MSRTEIAFLRCARVSLGGTACALQMRNMKTNAVFVCDYLCILSFWAGFSPQVVRNTLLVLFFIALRNVSKVESTLALLQIFGRRKINCALISFIYKGCMGTRI